MSRSINRVIRELEINDLEDYLYLNHPSREFHKFNEPYYDSVSYGILKDECLKLKFWIQTKQKERKGWNAK